MLGSSIRLTELTLARPTPHAVARPLELGHGHGLIELGDRAHVALLSQPLRSLRTERKRAGAIGSMRSRRVPIHRRPPNLHVSAHLSCSHPFLPSCAHLSYVSRSRPATVKRLPLWPSQCLKRLTCPGAPNYEYAPTGTARFSDG